MNLDQFLKDGKTLKTVSWGQEILGGGLVNFVITPSADQIAVVTFLFSGNTETFTITVGDRTVLNSGRLDNTNKFEAPPLMGGKGESITILGNTNNSFYVVYQLLEED